MIVAPGRARCARPPIHVDLGFPRQLPALRDLDLSQRVRHARDGPSPLDPPFEGLSRGLERVSIDPDDPEPVRDAARDGAVRKRQRRN
jgi:hypothetical protein